MLYSPYSWLSFTSFLAPVSQSGWSNLESDGPSSKPVKINTASSHSVHVYFFIHFSPFIGSFNWNSLQCSELYSCELEWKYDIWQYIPLMTCLHNVPVAKQFQALCSIVFFQVTVFYLITMCDSSICIWILHSTYGTEGDEYIIVWNKYVHRRSLVHYRKVAIKILNLFTEY